MLISGCCYGATPPIYPLAIFFLFPNRTWPRMKNEDECNQEKKARIDEAGECSRAKVDET